MIDFKVINSAGYEIGFIVNSPEKLEAQKMAKSVFEHYFDVREISSLGVSKLYRNCAMDQKTLDSLQIKKSKLEIDCDKKRSTNFHTRSAYYDTVLLLALNSHDKVKIKTAIVILTIKHQRL